jgi:hypothetical protein
MLAPKPHHYLASHPMNWSPEADEVLKEVPFFVRPIVRRRIESMAAEAGLATVDLAFYEQARERFGQK